ncbi:MAG: cytochrome c [Bacteroidetes bacterium]|nr:cytochrome c [Bacteroidota bacterium]
MKLKILISLIIAIAFINISCTNKKYDEQKQPAPDNSESAQMQQTQSTTPVQNTPPAPTSKYEFPNDMGVGPVKEVTLGPIDKKLAAAGAKIFNSKCIACHQLDTRLVGPPLRNITKKNTPEFIMNYLLNTTEMQKKDPLLIKLVNEYKIIMPDQQLSKDDARGVLEYFRSTEK